MDKCISMSRPITHPPFPRSPLPLPSPTREYLAWFDGACGPVNPGGTATFGVVIKNSDGIVLLKEHGYVGHGSGMSNNVAEYAGVLHVLKYLAPRLPGRVTIHGDSNLVINQLNGRWRITQRTVSLNRRGSQRAACKLALSGMADYLLLDSTCPESGM